jgi:hypothetical protein
VTRGDGIEGVQPRGSAFDHLSLDDCAAIEVIVRHYRRSSMIVSEIGGPSIRTGVTG